MTERGMKIENLTPEQQEYLPVYREEMRARGLRLQWVGEEEIRKTVVNLYASSGLNYPTVFVFDSPLACLAARSILKSALKDKGQLGDQLWDQLEGQLGGQLRGQLWGQLWNQLWDQLRGQLEDQLWNQLWGQLRGQLRDQLEGQLGGQLRGQLRGQLEFQSLCFAGGSEIYWTSYFNFARHIGVDFNDDQNRRLDAWMNYAETAGCLYPYEGVAFVSRRPVGLSFDENRQLHCENGPAMEFADGYSLYAWHGVSVPEHWIMNPEGVDLDEVIRCENVEQRAAGCAILGWSRIADKLNRKIIDGDPDTDIGALVELTLPGLPEPGRFLMAQCPRNGTICEGVPYTSDIDGEPINTAIAAQAWRDCLPASEYIHPSIRT